MCTYLPFPRSLVLTLPPARTHASKSAGTATPPPPPPRPPTPPPPPTPQPPRPQGSNDGTGRPHQPYPHPNHRYIYHEMFHLQTMPWSPCTQAGGLPSRTPSYSSHRGPPPHAPDSSSPP